MPTQQEIIDQQNAQLQADQEALYLQQQEQARKQAAQNTQTQVATPTTQGVQRIEGDFGGQEAFKVKGRPVNNGSKTVVINQKVLDEDLSRDAIPGGWKLPPSIPEEQVGRLFSPIAGEKPTIDQAKLDRLARMGRINEAGRVVGVAADVLGLGLGANVNKRPTDDLAAKLFDENDNVYKKLDDDKNKYRDRVAKWMNGRAAQPVYKTVTTTEKTNDIRETENVLLKTKPKDGAAGGKDNEFVILAADGTRLTAPIKKDQAMKALGLIETHGSAADVNSVRLLKTQMADGSINDNDLYYQVQNLTLKYPESRKFFGISDNYAEQLPGKTTAFQEGVDVNGKKYVVTGMNAGSNKDKEKVALRNVINEKSGVTDNIVAEIDMGGTKIGVTDKDLEQYRAIVTKPDPSKAGLPSSALTPLTKEQIDQKALELMKIDIAEQQKAQYQNPDGTYKPAAKITATGKDPLEF